ncbi:MAG: hypothetical protein SGCHY_005240, partial [Lobulomycetales sp.]
MLNQRLLHLEETLGTSATPVSTQLSDLTANVAAAVGASPAAAQLLSLMQAHRSTLSSPAALLPGKPDMLLAASDDLELFAEQLGELDTVKDELSSSAPALERMSLLSQKLQPLEARASAVNATLIKAVARYSEVLDNYNNFVAEISRVFVHYHKLLSQYESQVAELQ